MSRVLTFRGSIDAADNAISKNNRIFSYEASDLTRAWKVKSFYLWPETIRAEIGTADGQWMLSGSLATDVIGGSTFTSVCTVNDNRQFAWMQCGYNIRATTNDFINKPTGLEDNKGIVDPDHVINRELYVNLTTVSESTTSPVRRYNYLVVLEEIKISENEAILQMVKGVAQDIDN